MAKEWATADEISAYIGSRNWVVARRTVRIVHKYGEGVICVSQKKYAQMHEKIIAARTSK